MTNIEKYFFDTPSILKLCSSKSPTSTLH